MYDFAGYHEVVLTDHELGVSFPLVVFYPTQAIGQDDAVGPYQLVVARDAPVAEGIFPLVVISHGRGSSPFVYRTLAHYLARQGFVVGLPEHPGNNRRDNTWEGTTQNLVARPSHLRLAIQQLFKNQLFARVLKPDGIGVIGHSMGGYTALALAGGTPTAFPHETVDGQEQLIAVVADTRIKALVLLAPATVWFRAQGALHGVDVPMLLLTAEKDEYTPFFHSQIVLEGVADKHKIEHRIIENAGHYSFLSPFPASMQSPTFLPSQEPPGFNRVRFQEGLHAEIAAFLRQKL
ncbi:alpha/beta hydrolase family protein [Hymenobacter negativus]|uniref:Alpha/beta fold hydrolase n=1 Tax=Hymenobacter negativus TaxID=2795026 RepID=A0ABS3QL90_9BACT|nr:alpha/beta fold hydrolase [Hymenobacter negativus]MBO2011455.1 alpha/beta fold hydrolase [Hymenobacter negativus]